MKRLLLLALTAMTLLMGTTATACEKHRNGNQSGSSANPSTNPSSIKP